MKKGISIIFLLSLLSSIAVIRCYDTHRPGNITDITGFCSLQYNECTAGCGRYEGHNDVQRDRGGRRASAYYTSHSHCIENCHYRYEDCIERYPDNAVDFNVDYNDDSNDENSINNETEVNESNK